MPIAKLKTFLDNHDIRYVTLHHSPAYTAQEIAEAAHIPGRSLAKSVMLRIDGKMAMAVLPATYQIDFEHLRRSIGAPKVELAAEADFSTLFPNCEPGAMPPFGNLYNLEVFVDASLREDEWIAFNAGSFTEIMQLGYSDYEKLVQPVVLNFALHE